jgi:soluble lytic murein transglycosylase
MRHCPRVIGATWLAVALAFSTQPTSAAPILPQFELATVVSAVHGSKCEAVVGDLRTLGERLGPTGARAQYLLAHCHLRTGQTDAARDTFDRVATEFSPLAPYAIFYAASSALQDGHTDDAAARLEHLLSSTPPPPLLRRGRMLHADALIQLGRYDGAEAVLLRVLGDPTDDATFARAWWLLGQAAEGQKKIPQALRAYRMAWWSVPEAADADAAVARLRVLQSDRAAEPSAESRLQRGRRLMAAGEFAAADREFTAALHEQLDPDAASDAWYYLGRIRLGSTKAVYAFEQATTVGSDVPRGLFWQGRALASVGRAGAAQDKWARVARDFAGSVWAPLAVLSLAGMADVQGDLPAATRWLRELAQRYPQTGAADEARWRVGWFAYRAGRYAEAEREFLDAANNFPSSWRAPACLYWAAKARMRLGKNSQDLLEDVARRFPLTYYGQRAREVAHLSAPEIPPAPIAIRPREDRVFSSLEELAALGFYEDAAELAEGLAISSSDDALAQTAAWLHARTGEHRRAVVAIAPALRSVLIGGARGDFELWSLAYPLAYWPAVRDAAEAAGIDPYLVLSVMREESTFDPRAVSPAGAVGLLQLMPTTASVVARAAMRSVDLMDPQTNILTGTRFLGGQLRSFRGDVVLALAAYNAGPFAARRIARRPRNDPDVFLESIGIAETRFYVEHVLQTYGIYRWLYR